MYKLCTTYRFKAQHRLPFEEGPEAEMHSHDYRLEVVVSGNDLDENGFLLDIIGLRNNIDGVLSSFRDMDLNEIDEMKGRIPSLENLALSIWEMISISASDAGILIDYIKVWENLDNWVLYRE